MASDYSSVFTLAILCHYEGTGRNTGGGEQVPPTKRAFPCGRRRVDGYMPKTRECYFFLDSKSLVFLLPTVYVRKYIFFNPGDHKNCIFLILNHRCQMRAINHRGNREDFQ